MKIRTALVAPLLQRRISTRVVRAADVAVRLGVRTAAAGAALTAVVAAGCAAGAGGADQPCATTAPAPRVMPSLVLAAPIPDAQPEGADGGLALASRLDGEMGARRPDTVVWDVTDTWILDQQFTWNGRPYDNYVNQQVTRRRTVR